MVSTGTNFEDYNTRSLIAGKKPKFRTGTYFEDCNTRTSKLMRSMPFRTGTNFEDCNTRWKLTSAEEQFYTRNNFEDYNTHRPWALYGHSLIFKDYDTNVHDANSNNQFRTGVNF